MVQNLIKNWPKKTKKSPQKAPKKDKKRGQVQWDTNVRPSETFTLMMQLLHLHTHTTSIPALEEFVNSYELLPPTLHPKMALSFAHWEVNRKWSKITPPCIYSINVHHNLRKLRNRDKQGCKIDSAKTELKLSKNWAKTELKLNKNESITDL